MPPDSHLNPPIRCNCAHRWTDTCVIKRRPNTTNTTSSSCSLTLPFPFLPFSPLFPLFSLPFPPSSLSPSLPPLPPFSPFPLLSLSLPFSPFLPLSHWVGKTKMAMACFVVFLVVMGACFLWRCVALMREEEDRERVALRRDSRCLPSPECRFSSRNRVRWIGRGVGDHRDVTVHWSTFFFHILT